MESCRDRGGDARDGARAPVRGLDRATRIRRDRECLGTSRGLCVVPGETRGRRATRVERRRVRRGWHGNRGRRRVLSAAYASGRKLRSRVDRARHDLTHRDGRDLAHLRLGQRSDDEGRSTADSA